MTLLNNLEAVVDQWIDLTPRETPTAPLAKARDASISCVHAEDLAKQKPLFQRKTLPIS
jgi:hypothetical protein